LPHTCASHAVGTFGCPHPPWVARRSCCPTRPGAHTRLVTLLSSDICGFQAELTAPPASPTAPLSTAAVGPRLLIRQAVCLLISQLTSISGGHSPIRRPGTRWVAVSALHTTCIACVVHMRTIATDGVAWSDCLCLSLCWTQPCRRCYKTVEPIDIPNGCRLAWTQGK